MTHNKNAILVIGKPNSGKSGFFGQLYTRLALADNSFAKLVKTPDSLGVLTQITDRYAEGRALEHTTSNTFEKIDLQIKIGNQIIELKYPDYGGEQVERILESRRLNDKWHSSIQESGTWMLFIRVNDLDKTYDPIQKFTEAVQSGQQKEKKDVDKNKLPSDQAFYIELIQMLLYFKEIGFTQKLNTPKLIVVLSCWDELENGQNSKPEDLIQKELPLFHLFLRENWLPNSFSVLGLSSQGKSLNKEKADADYIYEEEGYLIKPDGEKTNDLTSILHSLLPAK